MDKSIESKTYSLLSRAQDKEDIWAYENWFFGYGNGTILESGGLDGLEFSNSLMLEKFADWKTILIEAHKGSFGKLTSNRPEAVCVNAALCSSPRVVHYVHANRPSVGGIYEFMPQSFIRQWHAGIQIGNMTSSSSNITPIMCLPIKTILKLLNLKEIDIWVLDVEGAELSVLRVCSL